jgi:hypothetical protein
MARTIANLGTKLAISANDVANVIRYGNFINADLKTIANALVNTDSGKEILFAVAKLKQEQEKKNDG